MTEGLTVVQVIILCGYALGMAVGQVLFKLASAQFVGQGSLGEKALAVLQSGILRCGHRTLWRLDGDMDLDPELHAAFESLSICSSRVRFNTRSWGHLFGEQLSARLLLGNVTVLLGLLLVAA